MWTRVGLFAIVILLLIPVSASILPTAQIPIASTKSIQHPAVGPDPAVLLFPRSDIACKGNLNTYIRPVCTPQPTNYTGSKGEYNYVFAGNGANLALAIDINASAVSSANTQAVPTWQWNGIVWTNITGVYPLPALLRADVFQTKQATPMGMVWNGSVFLLVVAESQSVGSPIYDTYSFVPSGPPISQGWHNLSAHPASVVQQGEAGIVYDPFLGLVFLLGDNAYGPNGTTGWVWEQWSGTAWVNKTTQSHINLVGLFFATPYMVMAFDPSSNTVIGLEYNGLSPNFYWLTYQLSTAGVWSNISSVGQPGNFNHFEPDPMGATVNGSAIFIGNNHTASLQHAFMWQFKSNHWTNLSPILHNPPPCGVDLHDNGQMPESAGLAAMAPQVIAEYGGGLDGVLAGTGNATCKTTGNHAPTDLEDISFAPVVPPPPPNLGCGQSLNGSGPVAPSLSDPLVLQTMNSATLQRNAYIETIKSEQCLTTFWVSGTPEVYYANVTGIAALATSLARDSQSQVTPVANQTWINASAKCQAYYCFPNETICDSLTVVGQLPRSLFLNRPCTVSGVEYAGPLPLGFVPQYVNITVTRFDSFLVQPAAFWLNPNAGEEATAMNLSILTAKEVGMNFGFVSSTAVNNQTFLTAYVTLAVPYPKGTWDPTQTQVRYYSNASRPILNFDQTLTDIVVSWRFIQTIQNITIALFGAPGGTFGNGNESVPSNINLALLNITALPGGLFEATATWTNPYASNFVGSITCTGPWTSTAIDTNASIDSAPVLSVPTPGSVFLLSGQLNASNATTIIVAVAYLAGSTYTATGPIGFLNGVPFSWIDILLAVAIALAISAYALRKRKGESGPALMAATGIVMIGLVGSIWLAGV